MEQRRRAPHRTGQRTTLRVPESVMQAARALAEDLGTTPNDALVRLAEEGVAASEKRRAVERLARRRREAVVSAPVAGAPGFPSPDEMRAAMLSGRREP